MVVMKTRKLLALDTSTRSMTAAVLVDGRLLAETQSIAERNHSLYLIPSIRSMLQEQGLKPNDIEAIAVGVGPGSYTGVRIGVTVAKTMAWSLQVPVIGVSSLQALARRGIRENGAAEGQLDARRWLVPLMDARRKQAYGAVYAVEKEVEAPFGERWHTLLGDSIRKMEQWLDMLAEIGERDRPDEIVMIGDTEIMEEYAEAFAERVARFDCRLQLAQEELKALDIGVLGLSRMEAGEHDDLHELVPNYTQLAEAEVKLLAKQSQGGEERGGSC
jgi:tRNA threonylcarbamoyladenosine biosynthesis protein TsaB